MIHYIPKLNPLLVAILTLSIWPMALPAMDVKLPAIISDHMIIQHDARSKVWGWANPGSRVSVSFKSGGESQARSEASVAPDGTFKIEINLSGQAGKTGELEFRSNGELSKRVKNVLVGDVWLASGQSNMSFKVSACSSGKEDIPTADHPHIRFFYVPRSAQPERQNDFSAIAPVTPRWIVCTPESVKNFSAVAYYFAREIQTSQRGPVGVIECAWGGSMCEAWLSETMLKSDPELKAFYRSWVQGFGDYYKANKEQKFDPIDTQVRASRLRGGEHPVNVKGLDWNYTPQHRPGHLYNAMYSPIAHSSLRGVIWYQGESNARTLQDIQRYDNAMTALIRQYRQQSGNANLPVFWVNLAGFEPSKKHSDTWPALRDVQTKLTHIPYTGQALALDVGAKKNVHPRDKKTVGERLSRCARRVAYGEDLVSEGPKLVNIKFDGTKAILRFTNLSNGKLEVKGKPFFQMAGENLDYLDADILEVKGDSVVISCDRLTGARAVRYNWRGLPAGHLYNEAGLPATSFEYKHQ